MRAGAEINIGIVATACLVTDTGLGSWKGKPAGEEGEVGGARGKVGLTRGKGSSRARRLRSKGRSEEGATPAEGIAEAEFDLPRNLGLAGDTEPT